MKAEFGKYYLLKTNQYYFCVDIGRRVKFSGNLAVKCSSGDGKLFHFGLLVDTSNPHGPDYETNHEIEFNDEDIISEYSLRDMPLLYMDFPDTEKQMSDILHKTLNDLPKPDYIKISKEVNDLLI